MADGYALDEPSLTLGSPIRGDEVLPKVRVRLALARVNRHGLIAGATGTGKTKTLQLMAGQLSDAGVPVFAVDIKGDLSGLGAPGDDTDQRVRDRAASLEWEFRPAGHPIEVLSLSGAQGAQVRATIHSFGPILLGKVLDLNPTQTSILSLVFKYCDDTDLPLLDLADLRTTLRFLSSEEGEPILDEYGGMSKASLGVILRSIVSVEQEGADVFFGEPEFDVVDLLRTTPEGKGVVSLLEVADVMEKPRLFSTFVLWLLAQLYAELPEAGDLPQPKIAFFFDEAHLLFDDASEALMEQIERTARLIRSKGVGVYFVTHAPTDVPSAVLAQLGNRVQHAIRAFTPEDADALRKTARTFPETDFYDVEETITSLGIGEALVTVLSPKGVPTPLAAVRLLPPDSRMSPLGPDEIRARIAGSLLATTYGQAVDRESAHELITSRIAAARAAGPEREVRERVSPTTADGLETMTATQQRRAIEQRARELERARREADRERKAQERARRADERARNRMIETGVRTAGRVVTSRAGQSVLRTVFDTLFGRRR
jgi:hypothetical protein